MDKFNLFKTLQEEATKPIAEKNIKLTDGIKYDEYSVILHNNKEKTVYIPTKRIEIFETGVAEESLLTEDSLRRILRKCNGVTKI